jgi:hypothetical protein
MRPPILPPASPLQLFMSISLLLAPGLAFALLAAHFYRASAWLPLSCCVVLALLLPLRRAWVPRLVQGCLIAGTGEWLWTAFDLVQQRVALGQPWLRLVFILGLVALLTAASALVFRSPALRARYAGG